MSYGSQSGHLTDVAVCRDTVKVERERAVLSGDGTTFKDEGLN